MPPGAMANQCRRRQPPLGALRVSDPKFLQVRSTTVRKTGVSGWNCTAVADMSTLRTKLQVERLVDFSNGLGVAVFEPDKVSVRGGFPNPNQWGADCLVGIYGTGCFFGLASEHVQRWHTGACIHVSLSRRSENIFYVKFMEVDRFSGRERLTAEGEMTGTSPTLAVALYSPEDAITIEPLGDLELPNGRTARTIGAQTPRTAPSSRRNSGQSWNSPGAGSGGYGSPIAGGSGAGAASEQDLTGEVSSSNSQIPAVTL